MQSRLAFGVGMTKTGTHSIAGMFRDVLRAEHEPDAERLIRLCLLVKRGTLSQPEFRVRLAKLFAKLELDLNVSSINGDIIQVLCRMYPDARFVLTVRDAGTWLRSAANHLMTRPLAARSHWYAWRKFRFGSRPYTAQDDVLRARGVFSIDGFLSYWARFNARVIRTVPRPQLLIVPTPEIGREANALARFLEVDAERLALDDSHLFASEYKSDPLDGVDPEFVQRRIAHYTARLLQAVDKRLSRHNEKMLREAILP